MPDVIHPFEYCIFRGKTLGGEPGFDLWTRAYTAWHQVWSEVRSELAGARESISSDDFLRADRVGLIHRRGEVVAVHLYSFYDLSCEAYRNHSFLKHAFLPEFCDFMTLSGRSLVLCPEQLTVVPGWRRNERQINFAAILIALAVELCSELRCEAAIASTRNSKRINVLAHSLGWRTLMQSVVNGEPADLIYYDLNQRPLLSDPDQESLVAHLWRNRVLHSELPDFSSSRATPGRKAA